ncbi:hypothetical protein [Saccharopolyspora sp. NPDC002686]|uniref:hypothetical protein n=1 Tax=Saccharopolyspora sp. NPDC002686 TaxID=3154541 RepID=UPI00332E35EB
MTENKITSGASPEEIEAAKLLLGRLGVSVDDLVSAPSARPLAPTFAEYIPQVSTAVSAGTRRVYGSYWNRINDQWGDRRLDEPTPLEIKRFAEKTRSQLVKRRNARGGRGAAEHFIAAMRCLYNHAVADDLVSDNPAKKVPKPRRLPTTRRGLPDSRLEEINHTAATTGNDPVLDSLIIRLHTETACRRGGALALTPPGTSTPTTA